MSDLQNLLNCLKTQVGKPYVLGDEGPDSFDCSGLTQSAFKETCNINLPRVSTDQFFVGVAVDKNDLQAGDLIFFDTGVSENRPNHVGVVIGNNKMINANSYYSDVHEETYYSSYWNNCYFGAKRVLNLEAVFKDVPVESEFYEYIMKLYEKGVVEGYSDGTFKPENSINRAEVLKIILEAFEVPIEEIGELPFSDVKKEDWFFKYVLTAYNKGIVQGYPDNTFKPWSVVNRVECLKMALNTGGVNVAGNEVSGYKDLTKDKWYYNYAAYALNNALIKPVSEDVFGAGKEMRRGEMCKVVGKIMG
ncbi:MAG: cell wall hydrolase [Candidatus Peregrinibacteria bacterium GW2011_GWC2_33_13]|nr:MAG: cell wall hydrolase [Candidatus Peregrinibacteria bacterium GW2011_GWC2_33_13]